MSAPALGIVRHNLSLEKVLNICRKPIVAMMTMSSMHLHSRDHTKKMWEGGEGEADYS